MLNYCLPLFNRAIQGQAAPGSIFKVFTVEGWYEIPEALEEKARSNGGVENLRTFSIAVRVFFMAAVFIGGILGLSLANAVFVDEMIMDNTVDLERKVDGLAEEIRALRRELGRSPPEKE